VGTDDECAGPPDRDGDGHRADADCDDGDPNRYPGAPETCGDGIDQDCRDGDLECPPDPPDNDGDGFRSDVDCHDGDPSRYPGAPEICDDAIDQDCDGYDATCPSEDAGPVEDAGPDEPDAAPEIPDDGHDGGTNPPGPGSSWVYIPGLQGGCSAVPRSRNGTGLVVQLLQSLLW
jgi:hypothetical protein